MTAEVPLAVVDASVVVKWFVGDGEAGVDAAAELLNRHIDGGVRLVGPSLLSHEVLNVLRRTGAALRCCPTRCKRSSTPGDHDRA